MLCQKVIKFLVFYCFDINIGAVDGILNFLVELTYLFKRVLMVVAWLILDRVSLDMNKGRFSYFFTI